MNYKLYFVFSLAGQIEFGIFVANYILSFLLLILGLRAPGIMTARDYFSLHNSTDLFLDVSFKFSFLYYISFYF